MFSAQRYRFSAPQVPAARFHPQVDALEEAAVFLARFPDAEDEALDLLLDELDKEPLQSSILDRDAVRRVVALLVEAEEAVDAASPAATSARSALRVVDAFSFRGCSGVVYAFHILPETPLQGSPHPRPEETNHQREEMAQTHLRLRSPRDRFGPMGWRWHDGDGDGGRGLGDVPDLASRGGGGGEGAHCATRRVVQSWCHTEEVEPGRFVRKCEKTERLLRDYVGRPSELVESKTENTEEDVTDEIKGASHPLGFPTKEPFAFPGLRSDIEAIEKGFYGSLGSFLDEAERMTNDFFKSFGFPSTHDRDSRPFPRQPAERHIGEGTAKKAHENEYSEFGSQITYV